VNERRYLLALHHHSSFICVFVGEGGGRGKGFTAAVLRIASW